MRHLVVALAMALLLSGSALGAGSGAGAFITNSGNTTVTVIDTASNGANLVSPPVGMTHGVAVDPKGAYAYVTSAPGAPPAVHAIDPKSRAAVASVTFGTDVSSPFGIAVSPDGKRLFMSHTVVRSIRSGGRVVLRPVGGGLSAVDVIVDASGAVNMSVVGAPLLLGGATTGVAVSPLLNDGTYRVYVANGNGSISVIDPALIGVVGKNPVLATGVVMDSMHAAALVGMAVSPDGGRLYVADKDRDWGNKLWVVDTNQIGSGREVLPPIDVGQNPFGVAVSPKDGRFVFVANVDSDNVSVIDTARIGTGLNPVIGTPPAGDSPHGVSFSSDGSRVYVVNRGLHFGQPSVVVLNGTNGSLIATVKDGSLSSPVSFGIFVTLDPVIAVNIDIKPGSDQNTINLGSHGVTPVAILSTSAFDAPTRVNPATVTLAGAPVQLKGNDGLPVVEEYDVNGDGLVDLVVHVRTDAMQLSPSDTKAVLEGRTWADEPIRGEGAVRIVPSK